MLDTGYVVARDVLIRTLRLLGKHYEPRAVVVVGAQAIYLRNKNVPSSRAPFTSDSDFAVSPTHLFERPSIKSVLFDAGYRLRDEQPGLFFAPDVPPEYEGSAHVDLLVPEEFALGSSRRDGGLPGDNKRASRRTAGIELAVFDYDVLRIESFDRLGFVDWPVAGNAALFVSKVFKIGERIDTPARLKSKDIGDLLRILQAGAPGQIAATLAKYAEEPRVRETIARARDHVRKVFLEDGFKVANQLLRDWVIDSEEFEIAKASLEPLIRNLEKDWPT